MVKQEDNKVTKVFISYSHDNSLHKKWVGEFASKLIENGIDVILDQWDLTLGDDVPKFMEISVSEADRVLMICTETYAKKADAGQGGVGYEAMIVTGELIRDLGTSKFIPIIRQKLGEPILPKAVSTRFYIDLSEGHNFDEQFKLLLHELHQVPLLTKPPLGKSPFARLPSGIEISAKLETETGIPDIKECKQDIKRVYQTALDIARRGDLVAWRRIIRQSKESIQTELLQWRQQNEPNPPRELQDMHAVALEGMSAYSALISIALAGVESGRDKFTNQVALIDEILNPRNWNRAGYLQIVDLPKSIAYVYQALHGALCLQTNQFLLAANFARSKITLPMGNISLPLFLIHDIVGWPKRLGGNSRQAYKFLITLPDEWNWLTELFGNPDEFREALCSYYMTLNLIEFIDILAEGKEKILEQNEIRLDIPLVFLEEGEEITRRAYRLLIVDPNTLKSFWRNRNVIDDTIKKYWPIWINHLKYWLTRSHNFGFIRGTLAYENLIDDIE